MKEFYPNCFVFTALTEEQAKVDNNFNPVDFDKEFVIAELNAIWEMGYYNFI